MSSAYAIPIAMAAMSAASSVAGSMGKQAQAQSQAASLESQANAARRQAEFARQKGELEARAIERQKRDIRRKFEAMQGRNRANLGAGFVDMTSGSALDVSEGNILHFSEDMAENWYQVQLKEWETDVQRQNLEYQAEVYDAQADAASRSGGNLMTTLLGAGMAGMGSYFMGGMQAGLFGGEGTGESFRDPTLQKKWQFAEPNQSFPIH